MSHHQYCYHRNLDEIHHFFAATPMTSTMTMKILVFLEQNIKPISIRKRKMQTFQQISMKWKSFRNSPEFRPKDTSENRDVYRYFINNKKTELHIMRGDILKIKVDAIVNGLLLFGQIMMN